MAPKTAPNRPVAQNRKARHDYEIVETVECGIVLLGSEVKALRDGRAQLREAYARVDDGEVWLHQMHIPPYSFARDNHEPERKRKLLLNRREIDRLADRTTREHLTLVPLSVYFKDNRAKVELAVARGRKSYDKRHAIAARDDARDMERSLARRTRGE